MSYTSLGSASEYAGVGQATTLTVGTFDLAANDLLLIHVTMDLNTDRAPTVTCGAQTLIALPQINAGNMLMDTYGYRASDALTGLTVEAVYEATLAEARTMLVGKVDGSSPSWPDASSDLDVGQVAAATALSFGAATPSGTASGIAIAVHLAQIRPTSAAGSWSDGFASVVRAGADSGADLASNTLEIATKTYASHAAMSTTITEAASAYRNGQFLFIGSYSDVVITPVERTVLAGTINFFEYQDAED